MNIQDVLKPALKAIKGYIKTHILLTLLIIVVLIAMIVLSVVDFKAISRKDRIEEEAALAAEGTFVGEPDDYGLSANELVDGTYYIEHNGEFYPLNYSWWYNWDEDEKITDNSTSMDRIIRTTIDNMEEIPTVYLGQGDRLIFYSSISTVNYAQFERFMDRGASFGFYGVLNENTTGYFDFYFPSEDDDDDNQEEYLTEHFFVDSDAYNIYTTYWGTGKKITIASIGDTPIKSAQLSGIGMILGLSAGKQYDVNIYTGTEYNPVLLTADTEYLTGMECYVEADAPLIESTYQEINIPEYLLNGYYVINGRGLFRLVTGDSYTAETDFNERLLDIATTTNSDGEVIVDSRETTYIYSSLAEFNWYSTAQEGHLGYSPEYQAELEEKENEEESPEEISEAVVENVDVYIDDNAADYVFEVISSSGEGTVTFNRGNSSEEFTVEEQDDGTYKYTYIMPSNISYTGICTVTIQDLDDASYDFGSLTEIPEDATEAETPVNRRSGE